MINMKILKICETLPYQPIINFDGKYVPNGFLKFPEEFIPIFYPKDKRAAGFISITYNGTDVISCEWDEEAYQEWCEENPEPDYLSENKTTRIQQSKADLETYLAEHPILWIDGQYYSITQEKQNQLTSKILSATMAQTLSKPYTLTWNSTGEVCTEWTLSDLSALAFAIDKRVTALVTYQQEKEKEIVNASTQEELDAITIDYDTVL